MIPIPIRMRMWIQTSRFTFPMMDFLQLRRRRFKCDICLFIYNIMIWHSSQWLLYLYLFFFAIFFFPFLIHIPSYTFVSMYAQFVPYPVQLFPSSVDYFISFQISFHRCDYTRKIDHEIRFVSTSVSLFDPSVALYAAREVVFCSDFSLLLLIFILIQA